MMGTDSSTNKVCTELAYLREMEFIFFVLLIHLERYRRPVALSYQRDLPVCNAFILLEAVLHCLILSFLDIFYLLKCPNSLIRRFSFVNPSIPSGLERSGETDELVRISKTETEFCIFSRMSEKLSFSPSFDGS